ncbi:MAG: CHASE4 domain-containing protein [Dehalococcoidales bacterium]|nr:CHASE4 domain-containing protein [Dehalococcoidales bacterium]
MRLRAKAMIIMGVALLCMAGLIYITSRVTFMRGLEEIEKRETSDHVEQIVNTLSFLISDLEADTADWAARDDTYAFIENGNEEYIQSNIRFDTFDTLELNLMLFLNSSGQTVFKRGYDLTTKEEISITQDLVTRITGSNYPSGNTENYSTASGIILLKQGPALVASQPILTSENEGPVRGTVIFARYFDYEVIDDLSQLALFNISLHPINDLMYQDFKEAFIQLLQGSSIVIKPLSEEYIGGYTLLNDVFGKPALIVRIDVPRESYQLGQAVISYYILIVLGTGLVVGSITMLLIQKQVLSRFTRLIEGIRNITTSVDTSVRISMGGSDELSLVAGTINGMLAALEESSLEIRESEERYRDLFENANDMIQSVDKDAHFVYVNEAWRNIFDYSEEDVADLSLWDVIHPDCIDQCKEIFKNVISGESAKNIEADFITKNGTRISVEGNVSCRFENGEPVATRGIFHDITERKRAAVELQKLYQREIDIRKQLEDEIQKRVEYTRALIHELRTPITPVLAATELLLDEIKDERSLKLVQSIDRSASNLNRRIDELIDLIRGETDMLNLKVESVDVQSLLRDISYEVMPIALRDGYSLSVDLLDSNPLVTADRDRLRQIIMNLINNAFKFTPAGGDIIFRARENGKNLIVEIEDTGPGITKEEQKRLFDPYFRRVEDRERLSGLGLGLALAKKLVELHGGKIWVKSKRGTGSTFGFSIPLEKPG